MKMMTVRILKVLGTFLLVSSILFMPGDSAKAESGNLVHEFRFYEDDLSFELRQGYDVVSLPDCLFTRKAGWPQMPFKVVHFAIDQGVFVDRIEIIADVKRTISGYYNLYPAQKFIRMTDPYTFTPPDAAAYNSQAEYPGVRVSIQAHGSLGGTRVVTLHVYPLVYIPYERRLVLHTKIRFRMHLRSMSGAEGEAQDISGIVSKRSKRSSDTIKNMLKKMVANPAYVEETFNALQAAGSAGSGAEGEGSPTVDYLIITSRALRDDGVFRPLIDSKIAKGLSVRVETVEDIEATMVGRDTQEKMRNYIKDLYTNNGLIWVLLGGDTDIVPVRKALYNAEEYGTDPPCDMYFSDLDGTWDENGNGWFGEVGDSTDLYPDVYVGRAPVENIDEASAFVNKVLTYEMNASTYADKILLMGFSDFDRLGERIKEAIDNDHIPQDYKPVTKYYESSIPNYKDLTISAINEGYNIINHFDHGGIDGLAAGNAFISIQDVDALSNSSSPAVMFSGSCAAAAIDKDSIAEHFITNPRGGGAAFIGNSRIAYGDGTTDVYDTHFFKSLFKDGLTHIGQTLAHSKTYFIGQMQDPRDMHGWRLRVEMFKLNLLGDPEMEIRLVQDDYPLVLDHIGNSVVTQGDVVEIALSTNYDGGTITYGAYLAGDINHDNSLVPTDVLLMINKLNSGIGLRRGTGGWNPEMDFNNDNVIAPMDVLKAINWLNSGVSRIPSGTSIDGNIGVFRWQTDASHVGVHYFTFVASAGELLDAKTVEIEVVQPPPVITQLRASNDNTSISIDGAYFGNSNADCIVHFRSPHDTTDRDRNPSQCNNTNAQVYIGDIPGATYTVTVETGEGESNPETLWIRPYIDSAYSEPPYWRRQVRISGKKFGNIVGNNGVYVYGYGYAQILSWSDGQIVIAMPARAQRWRRHWITVKTTTGWSNWRRFYLR